jgi:hypothetical protein
MLSVQDAMKNVRTEFTDLFGKSISDIRLEEIEQTAKEYHLTVSFLIPDESAYLKYDRLYKDVHICSKNGKINSIKIHRE